MSDISIYERIPSIENNFSVKFRIYTLSSGIVAHWHEHIELVYLKRGRCTLYCNGTTEAAEEGDLMVINSTEVHSFEIQGEITIYSTLLYPEFFNDVKLGHGCFKRIVKGDVMITEMLERMREEYEKNAAYSDMMIKSMAYSLIAHLGREHLTDEVPKRIQSNSIMLERLSNAIRYISDNYSKKITTRTLAEMSYMNESHFCRFFKSMVGRTPIEYIKQYKVEKACVLLKSTAESIEKISEDVGFDDMNYFSRVFKRYKGVPPIKYRRENQSGACARPIDISEKKIYNICNDCT